MSAKKDSTVTNEPVQWSLNQKVSLSKTISEDDVYLFAEITGDFNPVHINEITAQKSILGERVAHGILV